MSVRWLWRCGAVPNCRVLADARCDPRGRLVAVAVATGGGATPAAASRHSDSLTALHPPHLARPFLVAGWLTDRQADHAPARPCHLRSASQHEGCRCRCHRRVGQGGGGTHLFSRGSTVRPAINCPAPRAGARASVSSVPPPHAGLASRRIRRATSRVARRLRSLVNPLACHANLLTSPYPVARTPIQDTASKIRRHHHVMENLLSDHCAQEETRERQIEKERNQSRCAEPPPFIRCTCCLLLTMNLSIEFS